MGVGWLLRRWMLSGWLLGSCWVVVEKVDVEWVLGGC